MKVNGGLIAAIAVLIAVGMTIVVIRTRPKEAHVIKPARVLVTETIAAAGRLRGNLESDIGAQNQGRVTAILVHEGDIVAAGQAIARLDSGVLSAQMNQAEVALGTAADQLSEASASVRVAQAQLELVSRPPLSSEVTRVRAEVSQSVRVRQAQLIAATQRSISDFQRFQEAKNGPRQEEIEQANAQVKQAETTAEQNERDWNRQQHLFEQGFISRSAAEQARTNFLVAKKSLETATAKWEQLRRGSRSEQIAQAKADYLAARADIASAQAELDGARTSGSAQITSLLSSPRVEDIAVAREQLQQARRARDVFSDRLKEAGVEVILARKRLAESVVTAPFAGTVTAVLTDVGAVTGPTKPILRLVRTGFPEIRVELDESNLGKLRVGQDAIVTNDAFPGSRFTAKVQAIGAQVDTDRGTVEVRLRPHSPPAWIRPGQTFTVNIITQQGTPRLVVPVGAVSTVTGVSHLSLVQGGKVVRKVVRTLPFSANGVPVVEGINPESLVILQPAQFKEGEAVRIKEWQK